VGPAYRNVQDVEADPTHVLLSADTLLRRPLEAGNARVLDLVEVLHTLRDVDEQVGAGRVGAETPDLSRLGDVPAVLVGERARTDLEVVARVDLARLDVIRELILHRDRLHVETVVLVLRLRERNDRRLRLDRLTVRDDRLADLERDTGVVVHQVLGGSEMSKRQTIIT
jgi:hypothetical protein